MKIAGQAFDRRRVERWQRWPMRHPCLTGGREEEYCHAAARLAPAADRFQTCAGSAPPQRRTEPSQFVLRIIPIPVNLKPQIERGSPFTAPIPPLAEQVMIVCLCHRISESDIERVARRGCESFEALQEATGVATGCGTCHECAVDTYEKLREPAPSGWHREDRAPGVNANV
jgi:bacterioferritin-associated ferredoxin